MGADVAPASDEGLRPDRRALPGDADAPKDGALFPPSDALAARDGSPDGGPGDAHLAADGPIDGLLAVDGNLTGDEGVPGDLGPEPDSGATDVGPPDADPPDQGAPDQGAPDQGAPDLSPPCEEGAPCETGRGAPCGSGRWLCGGVAPLCVPPSDGVERCDADGLDNDCDGSIDNVLGVGDDCSAGIGGCAAPGVNLCDLIDQVLACSAVENASRVETCNGADDDCDSATDEAVPSAGPCVTGAFGLCAAGVLVCENGSLETCRAVAAPGHEVCNGLDDDCNDAVDDLLARPSLPEHCGACGFECELPNALNICIDGACGIEACTGGFLDNDLRAENGCELRCRPSVPPEEACNGRDDDCDGSTDPGETCLGIFDFCARRVDAGDVLCEDFPSRALDAWVPQSVLGVDGPLPIATQRHYTASEGEAFPAGHTRFVPTIAGAFSLGFRVFPGTEGAIGAGLFNSGEGYALQVTFDPPTATFFDYPRDAALGAVLLPDPIPRDGVRVEVNRMAGREWSLRVDGRTVEPLNYQRTSAAFDFDRVTLFAHGVSAGATRPALGELVLSEDSDGDELYWPNDLCPSVADPEQSDTDGDGRSAPCDDTDGDGVEDGPDNCRLIENPDQADLDADGFGDACDVDGLQIGVMMATSTRPYLWRVDPVTGLRGRGVALPEGAGQAVLGPDNLRILAVVGGQVRIYSPAGLDDRVVDAALRPQWLAGGRILYTAADRLSVISNIVAGNRPTPLIAGPEAGDEVMGYASTDGRKVAVVRSTGGVSEVGLWIMDGDDVLVRSGAWIPLPAQGATLPWVQPHNSEARFAYASLAGQTPGTGELDGVRASLTMFSILPASAVSYIPGEVTRLVAVERQPRGSRLALFAEGAPVTALTHAIDGFGADGALSFVTPAAPPAWVDGDSDGIEDASDTCPGLDDQAPLSPVLTLDPSVAGGGVSLDFSGRNFGVSWLYIRAGYPTPGWSLVDGTGGQATPPVALDNGRVDRLRVRWARSLSGGAFGIGLMASPEVRFIRIHNEGEIFGPDFISASQFGIMQSVVLGVRGGSWYAYRGLERDAVRIDNDGTVTPIPYPQLPHRDYQAIAMASGPGGLATVSSQGGYGPYRIEFFETSGAVLHALLVVPDTDLPNAAPPAIASSGSEWAVLYQVPNGGSLMFRRISAAGQFVGQPLVMTPGASLYSPQLAWGGDHWGVAFTQIRNGVRQSLFVRISADGTTLGAPVALPRTAADPYDIDLACTGRGYGAVWQAGGTFFTSGPLHCR